MKKYTKKYFSFSAVLFSLSWFSLVLSLFFFGQEVQGISFYISRKNRFLLYFFLNSSQGIICCSLYSFLLDSWMLDFCILQDKEIKASSFLFSNSCLIFLPLFLFLWLGLSLGFGIPLFPPQIYRFLISVLFNTLCPSFNPPPFSIFRFSFLKFSITVVNQDLSSHKGVKLYETIVTIPKWPGWNQY